MGVGGILCKYEYTVWISYINLKKLQILIRYKECVKKQISLNYAVINVIRPVDRILVN